MSDRSSAAYKAWETRRANGWVHPSTIVIPIAPTKSKPVPVAKPKAKSKLVQLSAAEKAWITRRANGWVHPKSRPQPKRGKSKRG